MKNVAYLTAEAKLLYSLSVTKSKKYVKFIRYT